MSEQKTSDLISLSMAHPIWDRFFTVAPLIVVGSREPTGEYDLAPKHMATPLSWENHFGFVCTSSHATYRNVKSEGVFTVTFPTPNQVIAASLAAGPRCQDSSKPSLRALATMRAKVIDGVFLQQGYLFLECRLDRIVDGFGSNSLIAGKVVAAHVAEQALRMADLDDQDLLLQSPLLAYLAPGRYATIDRSLSFPLPAGFRRDSEGPKIP
jgi:flavin reductase (DIM6/NTAB) family NADH-FMN oxidoreductase RutF